MPTRSRSRVPVAVVSRARIPGRGFGKLSSLLAGVLLGVLFTGTACRGDDTLQVRWTLREGNTDDGTASRRARDCESFAIDRVQVELHDVHEPWVDTRRVPCIDGNGEQYATVFDVVPSTYEVQLRFWATESDDEVSTLREPLAPSAEPKYVSFDPDSGFEPVEVLDWTPDPVDVTLSYGSTDRCQTLAATWEYAEPQQKRPADDADRPSLATRTLPETEYRLDIGTGSGLKFDGEPQFCTGLEGPRLIPNVDRGAYRLRLELDGNRRCTAPLNVYEARSRHHVDLAQLECEPLANNDDH